MDFQIPSKSSDRAHLRDFARAPISEIVATAIVGLLLVEAIHDRVLKRSRVSWSRRRPSPAPKSNSGRRADPISARTSAAAAPTVGVRGIHHQIVAALGHRPLTHHATLVPQTVDALAVEQAERGRTPVVVIDEAHLLDHAQLESIRMLTNHDMDSSSPFACLLVGQPTLRRRMKLGVLAALDQRIGLRYAMPP